MDVRVNGERRRITFPDVTPHDVLESVENRLLMEAAIGDFRAPYSKGAKARAAILAAQMPRHVIVLAPITESMKSQARRMYDRARYRAAERKLLFKLKPSDVEIALSHSRGRCQVTGVPLVNGPAAGPKRNPYAPSLDRINSRLGYVPSNVRVVAVAVNIALNEFGDEVFDHIARGYVERQKVKASAPNDFSAPARFAP